MPKVVQLTIPDNESLPDIIASFSPEENYIMLKIGSECLREGRNVVAGLTQKEIYNKIKDESKDEIKKLELDLLVEREVKIKLEESIKKIYERQVEQLKKQLEVLNNQVKSYELENKDIIKEEVEKEKEKLRMEVEKVIDKSKIVLEEKDKQVDKLSETLQMYIASNNKSASHKGSEGEKKFRDYTETFQDFKGFEIIDKHTQGGEGDFHLHFEEFDVLVDAKNYKTKVPIDQRGKIKKDLLKNEHIRFSWLVSLNTPIEKFDKAPIMYEWINTNQCVVYVNNLTSFEDPSKILRIIWFTCKELNKFIIDIDFDETELNELRNKKYAMMDKIKSFRKKIREINTTLNTTKNLLQMMDDEMKEMIATETTEIVESNFSLFDEWWSSNIEVSSNDKDIILSTDLWHKFKQDNKDMLKEFEITSEKFKLFIKSKVPDCSLIIKTKNQKSAFDIKGIKMKYKNSTINIDTPTLEVELKKQKKVKREKNISNYFSNELNDKIINDYKDESKDIIIISEENNIRPWQVTSVLIKHKIIEVRNQARGYDKYKETDEYKSKIVN